ncbi:GGDEF domain-containing protein [Vibrio renipiscarius]|uniref:diguanylate cyclase n=1 Tax=Vibrio renipiscarius TaxID=1461322 RepID=A0A0C2NY86_9VIBR|nr:GGDEF domain-containing protein [Vibrio renipiscarius]KII76023.1 diguanylate cyclase [Vibrio renipiscarius]KII79127.1 diguanylate cyclase [Vibrio renipiscarius]
MNTRIKPGSFFALLTHSKTMLLAIALLLIMANLYVFNETRQLARSYSEQQNQATWNLFQLNKEFSSLIAITPFALENSFYSNRVALGYELTWSRFDHLLNARESDSFMKLAGSREFFTDLFQRYNQLEPDLWTLSNKEQAVNLANQLDGLYQEMLLYVTHNFRVKSPIYQQQMEQAKLLTHTQIILTSLLLICALIVGYVLHLESEYNKYLALTDSLTKIPNRLAMTEDANKRIDNETAFTICLIDLNNFKHINDQYGHQAGDITLQTIAKRFEQTQSALNCNVYRIGGDEFAILLHHSPQRDMEEALNTLLQCFDEQIMLATSLSVPLTASFGLARFPIQGTTLNELLKTADANMYRMKFSTRDPSRQGNTQSK